MIEQTGTYVPRAWTSLSISGPDLAPAAATAIAIAATATIASTTMPVAATSAAVASIGTIRLPRCWCALSTIEVGFALAFDEFGSAFDGHGTDRVLRWITTAHLRALLLQDGLARKANAIAFDGEHFYQHLIALLQFIAHVGNAMLSNFADVQQPIGAGENLDE